MQGEVIEDRHDAVGVNTAVDVDGQCFAGEFVDDVEHLQGAAVGGGVELEVHRPDHVRTDLRHRPDDHTDPGQALLPAALGNPQALLAPQSADTLVVDRPAPARRAILAALRHPQRGRSVENLRSQARSSVSSVLIGGGARRIVDRCRPTTVQALRSETPNRSRSAATALRLRFGVRSFPPRSP